MGNNMDEILDRFEVIELEHTKKVSFLKRCDFKYALSLEQLTSILEEVESDYYMMYINDVRIQSYRTTYFDTKDNMFYLTHHNGRNNRLKVRKREYLDSDITFFEIKKKNLAGKTSKSRIVTDTKTDDAINAVENEFLEKITGRTIEGLTPKIDTNFRRITLVSKLFNERVTIDLGLSFNNYNGTTRQTKEFVIIEVKCDQYTKQTVMRQALKKRIIRSSGFSKYCVGRAITEPTLKRNKFKQKIKLIETKY